MTDAYPTCRLNIGGLGEAPGRRRAGEVLAEVLSVMRIRTFQIIVVQVRRRMPFHRRIISCHVVSGNHLAKKENTKGQGAGCETAAGDRQVSMCCPAAILLRKR